MTIPGPSAICIRPAEAADLAAVGELHVRSRCAAYEGLVPAEALHAGSPAAMAQWWTERWTYERDTHRLAVAQARSGEVVGFTYVGAGPAPGVGELYAIHVDPARQGGGVGRALLAAAVGALIALGEARAVLWVLTGNARARRFYERNGWRADGGEREAPIGPHLAPQVRYARPLT